MHGRHASALHNFHIHTLRICLTHCASFSFTNLRKVANAIEAQQNWKFRNFSSTYFWTFRLELVPPVRLDGIGHFSRNCAQGRCEYYTGEIGDSCVKKWGFAVNNNNREELFSFEVLIYFVLSIPYRMASKTSLIMLRN